LPLLLWVPKSADTNGLVCFTLALAPQLEFFISRYLLALLKDFNQSFQVAKCPPFLPFVHLLYFVVQVLVYRRAFIAGVLA